MGSQLASVLCFGLVLTVPVPSGVAARRVTVLPLAVHIAGEAGRPVVDRTFVSRQLASANRIFAPYGVKFVLDACSAGPEPTHLESRADRDRLGASVRPGVINWFVVTSLRDVDEPERMRRGVHWHSRRTAGVHYVIVAASAEPGVLAHELGHFLGNRPHSAAVGNLMSYDWRTDVPVLDDSQQRRLARAVSRYLRSGELHRVSLHRVSKDTAELPQTCPFSDW